MDIMKDNQVKKLPAFNHIKVLQDGNYGCTLCAGNKIYNGVFTQDWECIEKLHLVEVDAYDNYDYVLVDKLYPMLDADDITIKDNEEYARELLLNFEDNTIPISEQNPKALFMSQYQNGDITLTLENTLIPYKYFSIAFIENIFDKIYRCNCGKTFAAGRICWSRVEKVFGIDLITNNSPFDIALKQVIKEYISFENIAIDEVEKKYPDLDALDFDYDLRIFEEMETLDDAFRLEIANGAYDICYLAYITYLRDNCPDSYDDTLKL